ncbi:MAG: transporter [Planctomycetota bacterium]
MLEAQSTLCWGRGAAANARWRRLVVVLTVLASGGCASVPAESKHGPGVDLLGHGDPDSARADAAHAPGWIGSGFFVWPSRASTTGALSTDRPGFADSTSVTPRGHTQLELGYTFTQDRERAARTRDQSIAQSSLRAGLLDNLELRFLWNGFSVTETKEAGATEHDDGAGDMTVGLRSELIENDGLVPDLTGLINLALPVGASTKSAGDVAPDLRLAYGWALTHSLRVYGVGIAAAAVDDDGRYFQGSGSAGLSWGVTEEFSTFVEYFGIFPAGRGSPLHSVDGGFAFLLGDDVQVDVSAGFGLNADAPDVFVGVGLCWRW